MDGIKIKFNNGDEKTMSIDDLHKPELIVESCKRLREGEKQFSQSEVEAMLDKQVEACAKAANELGWEKRGNGQVRHAIRNARIEVKK